MSGSAPNLELLAKAKRALDAQPVNPDATLHPSMFSSVYEESMGPYMLAYFTERLAHGHSRVTDATMKGLQDGERRLAFEYGRGPHSTPYRGGGL